MADAGLQTKLGESKAEIQRLGTYVHRNAYRPQ